MQRQAFRAEAAEVRRVGRVASYRNNFIVGDRSEYSATNAAVAAHRGDLTPRFDQNKALFNSRGVHRNPHQAVLDAAARYQAEMLLVDRRGDDQLALDVADYSARDDIGAGEGIVVADGVDAIVVQPEERHLLALHEGAHPAVRHDVVEPADLMQLQLPAPQGGRDGSGRARRRRRRCDRARRCSRNGGSASSPPGR